MIVQITQVLYRRDKKEGFARIRKFQLFKLFKVASLVV